MLNDSSGILCHAWLASASLQPGVIRSLLNQYQTPEGVYDALLAGRIEAEQLRDSAVQALKRMAADENLRKIKSLILKCGIKAFTVMDPVYPPALRQLQDPPAILFYQGNIQILTGKFIAMVGSRSATYDGQKAAYKIASGLSRQGAGIVSGMADGIDTASHKGCIDGGSPTIAVSGCGLDIVYPSGNERLRDRIIEKGGLILSEYSPGERPIGWHFPFRNRIITGLADALVLVEAKIRSGSMTSVQHALDQGKDVFVYPGDPVSPQYEGNHQLLREGALYFTTAEDILEDLGWLDNKEIIRHNSVCSGRTAPASPEEDAVIKALMPGRLSFEQIAEMTGLSPSVLMSTITMLQIRGSVEALPGKLYQLK